jgi:hypothetical protein
MQRLIDVDMCSLCVWFRIVYTRYNFLYFFFFLFSSSLFFLLLQINLIPHTYISKHITSTKLVDSDDEIEDNTEKAVVRSKAEKTISLVVGDIAKVIAELPQAAQAKLQSLCNQGLLKEGEIGSFELKTLKSLTPEQQVKLQLF